MRTFLQAYHRFLARFGRKVTVILPGGGEYGSFAIIDPLRYKNKMYLDGAFSRLGYDGKSFFLYIGLPLPGGILIPPDTRVEAGAAAYTVLKSDLVYEGERPASLWAVMEQTGETGQIETKER